MIILQTFLTALFSAVALLILTRLMGYRQISQMSGYDYINGIAIGSLAAEVAIGGFEEFWSPLTALVVYVAFVILLSKITEHSIRLRGLISGKPLVLMENGKLCRESFKKGNIDLHEFLSQCRQQGYFDVSQLDAAFLEPNGRISCSPKPLNRPATPQDLEIQPPKEDLPLEVVVDGVILHQNLKRKGFEEKWLTQQLSAQNQSPVSKVFLATCTQDGKLQVF